MARNRLSAKGRRESGSFVIVPHAVLSNENYARLSHRAVRLLMDLYGQYRGSNNGDLCAAFTVMKKHGWKSKDQLQKAKIELLTIGWIVKTRQGGRNKCDLFAVTFQVIDDCKGKLDRSSTRVALGYWKLGHNPEFNMPTPNMDHVTPLRGVVGSN